jgi:hypothetical protein
LATSPAKMSICLKVVNMATSLGSMHTQGKLWGFLREHGRMAGSEVVYIGTKSAGAVSIAIAANKLILTQKLLQGKA